MQIKFKRALCDKEYLREYAELQEELIELNGIDRTLEAETLKKMSSVFEIIVDSDRVGYIGVQDYEHKASKSRMLQITDFMIKPEYRRKGYGSKILDEFIKKNKKGYWSIYCWCSKYNTNALEFYSKVGVFLISDPRSPLKFTNNYKSNDLIKLGDQLAVLFYEDEERYKGSELLLAR